MPKGTPFTGEYRQKVVEDVIKNKAQVVTELRQKHKLDVLLDVARLSHATYYYHLKSLAAPDKYTDVKDLI